MSFSSEHIEINIVFQWDKCYKTITWNLSFRVKAAPGMETNYRQRIWVSGHFGEDGVWMLTNAVANELPSLKNRP